MKKTFVLLVCLIFGIVLTNSCKKDDVPPTVTTTPVTSFTLTTAVLGGNVTSDGGAAISARGVCWAKTANPTISNDTTKNGTGTGSFSRTVTDLEPGTLYHVRAYAINSAGTAYGTDVQFTTTAIVVPTVTTTAVTSFTLNTAVMGGNVTSAGGGTVTARGVCWAKTASPTIANDTTINGTGTGTFSRNVTGLDPGTLYHVRAYAINSAGIAYGDDVQFTTGAIVKATVTTTDVTIFSYTTAVLGGNVTADGGGAISARGVCWAKTADPTTSNDTTNNGTGTGSFSRTVTGLESGTLYHVRAYAINSAGTAYGEDVQFSTTAILKPTVTTTAVTTLSSTTAVLGGNATADGGGTITDRGVCWAKTANPTISNDTTNNGTGTGSFSRNVTGLEAGTLYHVRAYAINSAGTSYGSDVAFTTDPTVVPSLTTTDITAIDVTTAVSGGNISPAGAGTILARGVCWATTTGPEVGDSHSSNGTSTGSFTSTLTSLQPGTKYYVRAYATNSVGTGYGSEYSFNTKIQDVEGNKYSTVTLGTQVWMAENLRTSEYNDGVSIPTTATIDLSGVTSPNYQWVYNNSSDNLATYGRLYTFYAANDPAGVCPIGWHVPTDGEWATLILYLRNNGFAFTPGLDDIAKSIATKSGWTTSPTAGYVGNDQASNNASGFSGLPGGFRKSNGDPAVFQGLGSNGYFGTSTVGSIPDGTTAWWYALNYNGSVLGRGDYGTWNGYSIRCVK